MKQKNYLIIQVYDDEYIYEQLEIYKKENDEHNLFIIGCHAYEFEVKNDWDKIEKLLIHLSRDKDIKVLTLKEAVSILF